MTKQDDWDKRWKMAEREIEYTFYGEIDKLQKQIETLQVYMFFVVGSLLTIITIFSIFASRF